MRRLLPLLAAFIAAATIASTAAAAPPFAPPIFHGGPPVVHGGSFGYDTANGTFGLLFWVPTGVLEGGGSFSIQATFSYVPLAAPVTLTVPLANTTPVSVIGPATSVRADFLLPTPPTSGVSFTPYRIVSGS